MAKSFSSGPGWRETVILQRQLPMSEMRTILYTRPGCHLCDDAKVLLERHGLTVESVNIDDDPQLVERFDTCVPVVFIDGKQRFRGRVNEVLLRRLLGRIEK